MKQSSIHYVCACSTLILAVAAYSAWSPVYGVPRCPASCPECGGRINVLTSYRCREYRADPTVECNCWRCLKELQSKSWQCIGNKRLDFEKDELVGTEPCGWMSREWFAYPWAEKPWEPS